MNLFLRIAIPIGAHLCLWGGLTVWVWVETSASSLTCLVIIVGMQEMTRVLDNISESLRDEIDRLKASLHAGAQDS